MAMRSTPRPKRARLSQQAAPAAAIAPTVLSKAMRKPEEDHKEYRLIQLPNEMRCLLISDPTLAEDAEDADVDDVKACSEQVEAEGEEEEGEEEEGEEEGEDEEEEEDEDEESTRKAACALCVGVGSFSDPEGLDGLAHFTEHMVFMGTEKFPTENEWSSYLSERGGEDNGETHLETTTCYFDVQPEHLKSCLERFASFYACPLFNFDSAAREVQAIESEFQQAKTEDENRLYQLICHLVAEKHGPSHPCGRFSWGNAKSLQELPAAAGVDMRAALRAFHEEHYSSRLMTLAVLGQEDLDTLEAMVAEAFHDMPNRHRPRPTFGAYRQPFAAPAPTAAVSAPPEVATPRQQHEGSWQPPLWVRLEPLKEKRTST